MTRHSRALTVPEEMRLFAGLIVQPFIAGCLAFLLFPLLFLDSNGHALAGGLPSDVMGAARSVAIGAGIVAFVVTIAAALPIAVSLKKRGLISLGEALLWGLGLGNVPMVLGAMLAGTYGVQGLIRGVAFSSLLGVGCAAIFWMIALRRSTESRQERTDVAS